ncbi:hypothetical protein ACF0H5_013927 [Mactra antiquata]
MATQERVIAIAIDGSDNSRYAFQFYVDNMRAANDKVYLIHAVEVNSIIHSAQFMGTTYAFNKDALGKMFDEEREKIKHRLEDFGKLLKSAGIDGTVKSVNAENPGSGICKAAEEVHASIIVVGTRGLGKLRRTLMGSVSDYILHHAHVPVLVCKNEADEHHSKKK